MSLIINFQWYHLPLAAVLSLLALFIFTFIYKALWMPSIRLKHLQKQGVKLVKISGLDAPGDMARTVEKYGDGLISIKKEITENPDTKMFAFQIGPVIAFSPANPSYIKEFLAKDYTHYTKTQFSAYHGLILGKSLLFKHGEDWKVLRKLTSQAFQFDVISASLSKIEETADWLYDRAQNGNLEKFRAQNEFQMGTGEVVGKIFFGDNLSKYSIEGRSICLTLADLVGDITRCSMNLLFFLFGMKLVNLNLLPSHRRIRRNINQFKAVCQQIIDAQRASGKKTQGFLQTFFDARLDPEFSRFVTDEVIIDQFILMFVGGTDTTSHVLSLSMYYLVKNPEMRKRIEAELDEVWPAGKPVDMGTLNKLEFMHAFIKEVLRVGSPIPLMIFREAMKKHTLLDIEIPKGTLLALPYIASHVNPKYYKNPEQFDPDRFLRKDPEEGFNKEPFAFMGFSAGPRNCIGQHVAMIKAKIFLAKLLRRFEFKLPDSYNLKMNFSDFYEPNDPLVFHLTPKDKSNTSK